MAYSALKIQADSQTLYTISTAVSWNENIINGGCFGKEASKPNEKLTQQEINPGQGIAETAAREPRTSLTETEAEKFGLITETAGFKSNVPPMLLATKHGRSIIKTVRKKLKVLRIPTGPVSIESFAETATKKLKWKDAPTVRENTEDLRKTGVCYTGSGFNMAL